MILEMGTPFASATITLSNDQILTGGVFQVLPATEVFQNDRLPLRLPLIRGAVFSLDALHGAYGSPLNCQLGYGNDGTRDLAIGQNIAFGTDAVQYIGLPTVEYNTNSGIISTTDLGSNGIVAVINGTTGGDPSNTLTVTVYCASFNFYEN